MEFPMDCFAFILWMTIVYLNLYIAMSKNRSFIFWFVLSVITGPIASGILMFILGESNKSNNLDEHVKTIISNMRFKRMNWSEYTSTIESLKKSYEIQDFMKVKGLIKSDIEFGKMIQSIFAIFASFIITLSVGVFIYQQTSQENFIAVQTEAIDKRYEGVEKAEAFIPKMKEINNITKMAAERVIYAGEILIICLVIIFILGFHLISYVKKRVIILNMIDFIIDSKKE